jgi:hypothetical protein
VNGFAPLIEGFLAFALTMLAMTTAVSSIVGALHHLRRRHARGLRDMIRVLYLRDLKPLADNEHSATGATDTAGASDPAALANTLLARPQRLGPRIKEVVTNLTKEIGAVWNRVKRLFSTEEPAAPTEKQREEAQEVARRALFIFDMTFMPVPDVVEKIQKEGALHWQTKLASAERLCGMPWYTTVFHPKRLARRWKTLRCGLAELTDAEFIDRLARSDLGRTLKDKLPAGGFQTWDDLSAHLLQRFKTVGGASSETFARHSRGWSVAVGFLLATSLNIDSIDLLNSYLTSPELRQQVIDRTDEIMSQQPTTPGAQTPATQGPDALAGTRARVDAAAGRLSATVTELENALPAITAALPQEQGQKVAAEVQARLQGVLSQAKGIQEGVGALNTDVTEARQQILGVTRSLTTSFPIGWQRFPNCESDSPDLRCGSSAQPVNPDNLPAWHRVLARVTQVLPARYGEPVRLGSMTLAEASVERPAQFYQWLAGVLLTGVLLGLGSPFWVQVVSSTLKLSRAAKDESQQAASQTQTPATSQTQTSTAGQTKTSAASQTRPSAAGQTRPSAASQNQTPSASQITSPGESDPEARSESEPNAGSESDREPRSELEPEPRRADPDPAAVPGEAAPQDPEAPGAKGPPGGPADR